MRIDIERIKEETDYSCGDGMCKIVQNYPLLIAEVERLRKLLDIAYKALEETSWNELVSQLHHRPACKAIAAIDAAGRE